MTTLAEAAICRGHDHPFAIEQVELADLAADEILVRVIACGICHTDLAVRDAQLPVPLPVVLGHEGAGIVEAVGSAVTGTKPGDRVMMSFNSCGACPSCDINAPTYCYNFFPHNFSGARADGTPCMHHAGAPMAANFFGQSAFATYAITHDRNTFVVPDRFAAIPLDRIAPIGCGLMTGAGAVLNAMAVISGLPIAVFGTGTVGMAAIMAAKIAGANPIIAVDMNDARLALALELGATHAFNARDDAMGQIRALCPQGIGYALDTTGINTVIEGAWKLLAPKGICGIVGASDPSHNLTFNEAAFMGGGRTVMGILGGNSDGRKFLVELLDYHLAGQFPFEKLIRHFDFGDINEAVAASEEGHVVKSVLRMGEE